MGLPECDGGVQRGCGVSLDAVQRFVVPRVLAAGSLVSAATALRVGAGCFELLAQRTPPLVGVALTASFGGRGTQKAEAEFRDEVLALARESVEVTWREMRRGIDELDAFTRPGQKPGKKPHRPYRVKL